MWHHFRGSRIAKHQNAAASVAKSDCPEGLLAFSYVKMGD
jgi:hypothetical protein